MTMISTSHTLDFQLQPTSAAGLQAHIDHMTDHGWLIIDAFPCDNQWGDHIITLHVIETPIAEFLS